MKIGILALQGAFIEHKTVLAKLKVEVSEVRLATDLTGLNGLIIPGGESTTILKLMHSYELFQPLRKMIGSGLAVWGTCAGMICLAKTVLNSEQAALKPLEVMDITVRRNAFGRQIDSFETDLSIHGLNPPLFHAVFIRAPRIEKVEPQVDVLARLADGTIVAAQQQNLMVTSFHPELTNDTRIHEYFLKLAST
jgi:pyridoxal 5'-phosphate synthase pdxT subunit